MGLFDFMQSDDARLGIGLLAAAGPSQMGFGERLQSVMSGMDAHKANQAKSKFYDMQYQTGLLGLDKARTDAAQDAAIQNAARAAMTPGQGFNTSAFLSQLQGIDPLKALDYQARLQKDDAPITVAPGASLIDRRTMKPVFTAPKEQELPSDVRAYEYAKGQGYGGTFTDWQLEQKRAGSPKVQLPAINLSDPTAVARAGMALQNDVRTAFKDHYTIADQYGAMQTAVKDPSPQGDTALLYSFFKVLDPASTVREGEIAMVNSNRSIPDRFKGMAQKLAGGGSLLPHERQDILNQARSQVSARVPRSDSDLKAYRDNTQRLGLDPELYAPDPYKGFKASEQPKAAATPLPAKPNASNLTKGTVYATPRGPAKWDGLRFVQE